MLAGLCLPAVLALSLLPAPPARHALRVRGGEGPQAGMALAGHSSAMEVARAATEDAAAAARFVARTYSADFDEGKIGKADASPVTVADFAVQAIVCKRLLDACPDDPVIAEESADELRKDSRLLARVTEAVRVVLPSATTEDVCDWIDRGSEREYRERVWTLDPIDGTKGFVRRQQYALCLALLEGGVPVAGALACPNLPLSLEDPGPSVGTLFCASAGGGAWQMAMPEDGGDGAARTEIRLRQDLKPEDHLRFCESVEAAHSNHALSEKIAQALSITRPPLRFDSQVKYGLMARGDADIYLRLPKFESGVPFGSTYQENIWCG